MNPKQLNVLLGAIAAIAIIVAGYFAWGNQTKTDTEGQNIPLSQNSTDQPKVNQQQNATKDTQTSKLKTYTNSQYGFQFQYDPKVYSLQTNFDGYEGSNGSKIVIEVYDIDMKNDPDFADGYNMFQVWTAPNPEKLSSLAYAKKYSDDYDAATSKKEVINGYEGIGLGERDYHIIVAKGNFIYDIVPTGSDDILPTFKFTK